MFGSGKAKKAKKAAKKAEAAVKLEGSRARSRSEGSVQSGSPFTPAAVTTAPERGRSTKVTTRARTTRSRAPR